MLSRTILRVIASKFCFKLVQGFFVNHQLVFAFNAPFICGYKPVAKYSKMQGFVNAAFLRMYRKLLLHVTVSGSFNQKRK